MEAVKTLAKNELWCTWKALWFISAKSCTFINWSWNLAGCSGLVTHCTQGSAPSPSLLDLLGAPLYIPLGFGQILDWQLAQDLSHAWYRWGYQGEEIFVYKECCISEQGEDMITEKKKMHQMFWQIWFSIRKVISQLWKYTVILWEKKKKA